MNETSGQRLASLDALRGLDMLVILGLDAIVWQMAALHPGSTFWREAWHQFGHVPWEGLPAYDLVFPLFVFMAGTAMCFSQLKAEGLGVPPWRRLARLWHRALWLVILGFLVNGNLTWDLATMRFASVLGLIGISGALAGSLTLVLRSNAALLTTAALLLGGVGAAQYLGGDMTPQGCVNAAVDALLCPGKLHLGCIDPEGPLCIVSATALSLAGFLCGRILLYAPNRWKRLLWLLLCGAGCLGAGCVAGPVIKNIWTPAFVFMAAGWGFLLTGLFHLVIDIAGLRAWSFPLRVVGVNALFAYGVTHIVDFPALTVKLFGGTLQALFPEEYYSVLFHVCSLLLAWLLCLYLYRKRIFIKL